MKNLDTILSSIWAKTILPTCLLCCFFLQNVNATIITVSNRTGQMDVDYSSLPDAITNASAGDTLYVHGSPFSYGDITIDKKLHIIGPGYYLAENNEYETETETAKVGHFHIQVGAEHSIVEGMQLFRTYIWCNNVTIRKNFWTSFLEFQVSVDSCYIYNNYIYTFWSQHAVFGNKSVNNAISHIYIVNNIIRGSILFNNPNGDINTVLAVNNTFMDGGSDNQHVHDVTAISNLFFERSIHTDASATAHFVDNLFKQFAPAEADTALGNVIGFDINDVLVPGVLPAPDADHTDLVVSATNPAIINCNGGCGATFGVNPHYRLSGIPEIPLLYHLTSDRFPDGSGKINVTVKAKSY